MKKIKWIILILVTLLIISVILVYFLSGNIQESQDNEVGDVGLVEDYENKLRMISLGKGHGMGLSQYGANEMAKNGNSYKEILKHYYSGIKFVRAYE